MRRGREDPGPVSCVTVSASRPLPLRRCAMSAIREAAILERLDAHVAARVPAWDPPPLRMRGEILADIEKTLDDFGRYPNPVMRPGLEMRLDLLRLELRRLEVEDA